MSHAEPLPSDRHPVQGDRIITEASTKITLRAYEVYTHVFGEQEAMVTGWCRGGFSTGELIAFLYARSFHKDEWRARMDEALAGLVQRHR